MSLFDSPSIVGYCPVMPRTNPKHTPNDLITLDEVCELVGLSPSGWRNVIQREQAPDVHRWYFGKEVRYSHGEIIQWIDDTHCPACGQNTRP